MLAELRIAKAAISRFVDFGEPGVESVVLRFEQSIGQISRRTAVHVDGIATERQMWAFVEPSKIGVFFMEFAFSTGEVCDDLIGSESEQA